MLLESTQPPLTYLVVLNWNGYVDTLECVQSLQRLYLSNYRILVVDNGSTDSSVERLAELSRESSQVEVCLISENHGIAYGYNRGIEYALAHGADLICVMNNDLVLDERALTEMIATLNRHVRCGMVMPCITYYDDPKVIWSAGGFARILPSNIAMRGFRRTLSKTLEQELEIGFAPSCCLLLSKELAERVSFDEAYFFYFDDWDYCIQAIRAGFKIYYSPAALIKHKVSRSTQGTPNNSRWWRVLGTSSVRYHKKHHGLALLTVYTFWVSIREIIKGNGLKLPHFYSGILEGLSTSPIRGIHSTSLS